MKRNLIDAAICAALAAALVGFAMVAIANASGTQCYPTEVVEDVNSEMGMEVVFDGIIPGANGQLMIARLWQETTGARRWAMFVDLAEGLSCRVASGFEGDVYTPGDPI